MKATIELGKHVTGTCIFGIVLSNLGHWQEFSLIILFLIDKCTKINLDCAILFLNLAGRS